MAAEAPAALGGYPVRYDVEYPEKLSRILNGLWLIKLILAIPHLLILYALGAVSNIVVFIAFFAILFTKRFPGGLFDLVVNVNRWQQNNGSYLGMLRDEYPPFTWEPGRYAVIYEVDYPEQLRRFAPLYKWFLAIPHYVVLLALGIATLVVYVIAWFAIVFTGRFPRGLFNFVVGVGRWQLRVNAYAFSMLTDTYPPFSLK